MATKKPMKKPVKRVRRFQEGGEAALKAEGLAASNKTPMGFFESLRRLGQGNIDAEGSEAYNRYGAGRGRMERDAASEAAANRMVDEARSAKGISNYQESVDQDEMDRGADMRNYEMMQRGRAEGERDEKRMAPSSVAQAQNAAILAAKPSVKPAAKPAAVTSKPATGSGGGRGAAVGEEAAYRASRIAAAPAASPAATSRNDSSTTSTQSAPASNGSKFDASDALEAGLAVASVIPIVRGGRTLYQAGKKMYQTYKAAKDAIKNRPKLDRPGTVSGEGFVMRDVKDPSAVAKAPQKALPAPRKSDVTDVVAKKRGGAVKKMAHGGSVKSSTASSRGDGIALRGKTRGKIY